MLSEAEHTQYGILALATCIEKMAALVLRYDACRGHKEPATEFGLAGGVDKIKKRGPCYDYSDCYSSQIRVLTRYSLVVLYSTLLNTYVYCTVL